MSQVKSEQEQIVTELKLSKEHEGRSSKGLTQ